MNKRLSRPRRRSAPRAELARIEAEISQLQLRAAGLTSLALVASARGMAGAMATMAFRYAVQDHVMVFWAGPAVLASAAGAYLLFQNGKLNERAALLKMQKRETIALVRKSGDEFAR